MGGHKGGKKKGGKKKVGRRDGKEATGNQARGNQQRLPSVRQQLASQDPPCTVHEIEADGNCLFRSLHDQLVGVVPGLDYRTLRATLLDYVEREAAFYASFVEDDETIDEYIARMREDGSWGGHIELHACARRYGVNVCVSQSNSPRWCIKEWPEDVMMLHITYHDGNHYNSVRTKDGAIARSMADGRAPMGVEPGGRTVNLRHSTARHSTARRATPPVRARTNPMARRPRWLQSPSLRLPEKGIATVEAGANTESAARSARAACERTWKANSCRRWRHWISHWKASTYNVSIQCNAAINSLVKLRKVSRFPSRRCTSRVYSPSRPL